MHSQSELDRLQFAAEEGKSMQCAYGRNKTQV